MQSSRWMILGVVALVQTAILGYMVYDRASLIAGGREILLQTEPVDPRSLFRGDYVILNYAISNVSGLPAEPAARPGELWHVTLQKGADGLWTRAALGRENPASLGPDQVAVRARVDYAWTDNTGQNLRLHYGIESYFVPEGEGRDLEKLVGTESLAVVVAVADDGRAAIKGLRIGDKVSYDEPLF